LDPDRPRVLSRLKNLFRFRTTQKTDQLLLTASQISSIEKLTGHKINNQKFYTQALIHRSFLEHNEEIDLSNERLEFLGDSVLNLIIGEYLFKKYPEEEEGFLTKVRAKIVNRKTLGEAGERLKLGDYLLLGSNLTRGTVYNSKSILSDTFEALIGAVYLDNGMDACKSFLLKTLIKPIMQEGEHLIDENYKSQLLEHAQATKMEIPFYEVVGEDGPQHDRIFTVRVSVGKDTTGIGKGKSKKSAEQNAAHQALEKLLPDNFPA
jgi:ribonuclease III